MSATGWQVAISVRGLAAGIGQTVGTQGEINSGRSGGLRVSKFFHIHPMFRHGIRYAAGLCGPQFVALLVLLTPPI